MVKKTSSRRAFLYAAALMGVGGQALAADDMPLGGPAAPPIGYVDLCERAPAYCVMTNHASASQLEAVRRWAGQTRWTVIFGQRLGIQSPIVNTRSAGVSAADAIEGRTADPTTRTTSNLVEPTPHFASSPLLSTAVPRTWKLTRASALGPPLPIQAVDASISLARTASDAPAPVADWTPPRFHTDIGMARLNEINRDINRAIRPISDRAVFGTADYWTVPSGPRAMGDCEDYVMAKRQALIEAGVPIEALSIGVVETNHRETHAVLLVATPDGEVVLDNLTPWIVSWREAPYRWLQRQARGSALTWVNPDLS